VRTELVVAGIVVLVVGVALIAGAASGLLARTTIFRTFSQPSTGEFVSREIVLNTTSLVEVRSPAANGALIPSNDLGAVDMSNIGTYAIPYNTTVAGTNTYKALEGSYYYIAFSQTAPSTILVAVASSSGTTRYGLVALAGFVLVIAGIALAIVGAIKKGNKKSGTVSDSEYYAKR
jgi:hypothetical protein